MLAISYDTSAKCIIRPVPLISITQNAIRNKTGMLGSYYSITLNGTILPDEGSPYYIIGNASSHSSPASIGSSFKNEYDRPAHESVPVGKAMSSIIAKQNLIRELFKKDGQLFELLPADNDPGSPQDESSGISDEPILKFYPIVESISFEEGIYINSCKYTVNLRAEVLLDNGNNIISDGLVNSTFTPEGANRIPYRNNDGNRLSLASALAASGFVEDYSESWSIEVDEGKGVTNTSAANPTTLPDTHIGSIRTYRLTRNVTATGRTMYYQENGVGESKRREAWEQAKQYVYLSVLKDTDDESTNNSTGYEQFPEYSLGPYFGSGFLNIAKDIWGGYNHLRTESIDVTAGTFTLNDTWLLSSGTAYEDYRMSLSKSSDNALHKVSIEGNIKGLSSQHAGGGSYGGSNTTTPINLGGGNVNTQYQNALYKFHQISNTGQYGPNCYLYRRAQSIVHQNLNHIPLSVSLGTNEFTGEITYNVEYDSRPLNLVDGTLSENISFNDTYPGDVFAIIPVLGRQTGPVLQYIGGRTEYKRDLTIELIMDRYYSFGTQGTLKDKIRRFSVLSKPSLNEPYKSQINAIIHAYSPINENGIRKYFISPPVESWDAKSGRYSLQINWTYELNR
jgi:hypothetical protein